MSATRHRRFPRLRSRQQGGTFAGLIIGLIIGLMVAVGVAMTIMKTPLPFVDKLGKQSQPAGELGDPNKTLPGGARERRERLDDDEPELTPAPAPSRLAPSAAPASSSSATSTPAARKLAEPQPTPAVAPAAPQRNDKTTAAVQSPAATAPASAAPASAASAPSASGDAFTYYLQAGAFRELQDAEATKGRLALMGVAASIAERKSELGTLYRVRVGPFADVDAMNRARVRLSDNGVDAAVVRVPK